jgi:uncharacterized protein
MSPAELALVFTLGIVIGGIGGLLGLGGGLIAIPLLGLAFGMSQQLAQGTAMVMIVGNTFLGLWRNHRLGNVEAKYAVTMAASAALFTWLTALVALRMESASLRFAFGVFVCVLALYTIWSNLAPGRAAAGARVLPWGWSSVVGAAGGALSGLFGVGAGIFAPPALTALFGMRQAAAQAHTLALAAPVTIVGLFTYAAHGQANLEFGIALALGGLCSVSYGVRLAHRLPEKTLRLLFSALLALVGVVLVAR